jgi:hypothetical protein
MSTDVAHNEPSGDDEEVRIGVTGHRAFDISDAVERVDALVDRVVGQCRAVVVSSLAEGADRLVAELVLAKPDAGLCAVLPLPADDYERDFASPDSVAEFRSLLARANTVCIVDLPLGASRDDAYERAGLEVVARCDVLIAVWDGAASRGRGGTAEIVEHARRIGRRVETVDVTRDTAR